MSAIKGTVKMVKGTMKKHAKANRPKRVKHDRDVRVCLANDLHKQRDVVELLELATRR
jgi:hypothetical protein